MRLIDCYILFVHLNSKQVRVGNRRNDRVLLIDMNPRPMVLVVPTIAASAEGASHVVDGRGTRQIKEVGYTRYDRVRIGRVHDRLPEALERIYVVG